MKRTKVEYEIHKRVIGTKFPHEFWDGPYKTWKKAQRAFDKSYQDDGNGKHVFIIVKVTYTQAPVVRRPPKD